MYTVVKTIKGRRYLYEQRTWREGRRVRTESRYLGPLDTSVEPQEKKSLGRRVREFVEAQGPIFSAMDKYAELAEQQALDLERDKSVISTEAVAVGRDSTTAAPSSFASPPEASAGEAIGAAEGGGDT